MEILWALAIGLALVCSIIAVLKAYETQGSIDLESNTREFRVSEVQRDLKALEKTVDSQTKRLNDHYSAIAGLRSESRRQRSDTRQLTRTVEAISAAHARAAVILGELVASGKATVVPKKRAKK